ncbi:MAG: hypothetical protein KDK65_02425 [Chlamydiia bacterium]|nr:hypothetical protein [Chlamydiia bacterium]
MSLVDQLSAMRPEGTRLIFANSEPKPQIVREKELLQFQSTFYFIDRNGVVQKKFTCKLFVPMTSRNLAETACATYCQNIAAALQGQVEKAELQRKYMLFKKVDETTIRYSIGGRKETATASTDPHTFSSLKEIEKAFDKTFSLLQHPKVFLNHLQRKGVQLTDSDRSYLSRPWWYLDLVMAYIKPSFLFERAAARCLESVGVYRQMDHFPNSTLWEEARAVKNDLIALRNRYQEEYATHAQANPNCNHVLYDRIFDRLNSRLRSLEQLDPTTKPCNRIEKAVQAYLEADEPLASQILQRLPQEPLELTLSTIPEQNFHRLENLKISRLTLHQDPDIETLKKLTDLRELTLEGETIKNDTVNQLSSLPLISLTLANSPFLKPQFSNNLKKLRLINLQKITPEDIRGLPLTSLSVENCPKFSDAAIGIANSMPLTHLQLKNCSLTLEGVKMLQKNNLVHVDLRNNPRIDFRAKTSLLRLHPAILLLHGTSLPISFLSERDTKEKLIERFTEELNLMEEGFAPPPDFAELLQKLLFLNVTPLPLDVKHLTYDTLCAIYPLFKDKDYGISSLHLIDAANLTEDQAQFLKQLPSLTSLANMSEIPAPLQEKLKAKQ